MISFFLGLFNSYSVLLPRVQDCPVRIIAQLTFGDCQPIGNRGPATSRIRPTQTCISIQASLSC